MKHEDLCKIMDAATALHSSLDVPVMLGHGEALKIIVSDLTAKYLHNAKRGSEEWTPIFEKVLSYYLSGDELEAITSLANALAQRSAD